MKLFNWNPSKNETKKSSGISSTKNRGYFDELATIKNAEGFYNFLSKMANPDVVLRKTGKGIETLRLLVNEGQVATCVSSRKAGVLSLQWSLKYPEGNEKYKEFYDGIFTTGKSTSKKINVYKLMSEILNAPLYGYQPLEIVWEALNGYVVPQKIEAKPQEWFFFNSDRQLCFKEKGNSDGVMLDEAFKKFLCPRHDSDYMNPYGQAVLSRCFWDVVFIKGGMEFWIKFIEKYGMPFFTGKYEEGASEADKASLLDMLEKMVQDACAIFPNNSTVEIKEAAGKSASAQIYAQLIQICKNNISKNILGQTLTTDVGSSGSYAAGKVHAEVREDIVNADCRLVIDTMNQFLEWIHEINFNDDNAPTFELNDEEDIKEKVEIQKAKADRDTTIQQLGVKFSKDYIQRTYEFEDGDIEMVEITGTDSKPPTNFAEGDSSTPTPQENIDKLADCFSDAELEKMIDGSIKQVIQHFAETKDPESTQELLATLYPDMKAPDLEEMLTKSIFISNIWGRTTYDQG